MRDVSIVDISAPSFVFYRQLVAALGRRRLGGRPTKALDVINSFAGLG